MKHGISGRKFGRHKDSRIALLMNLSRSLILHESIDTTFAKAKETIKWVSRMISFCRQKNKTIVQCYQYLSKKFRLNCRESVQKLFNQLTPRYRERPGGYISIIKLGNRLGDAAPIVRMSLVS
jgi:large subunit ribosomal protein L17